jgi:hypothetical protein
VDVQTITYLSQHFVRYEVAIKVGNGSRIADIEDCCRKVQVKSDARTIPGFRDRPSHFGPGLAKQVQSAMPFEPPIDLIE